MDPSTPKRETAVQRSDRQAAYYRELAEINMDVARLAAKTVQRHPDDASKHILDLSRATRGVVVACNAENALFRDEPPLRAAADDRRRNPLHRALADAAKATRPDGAARAQFRRVIAKEVEATLAADPAGDVPIHIHLADLARSLGLVLNVKKLPDELIGMPLRIYPDRPPGWRPEDG